MRRLEAGDTIAHVARACEVHPSDLHRWRRELQEHGERAFGGAGVRREEESRVAELERKIGRQQMEIDFLKRALQRGRGAAPAAGTAWRRDIYRQIEKETDAGGSLTVQQMCNSGSVSRGGFYRFREAVETRRTPKEIGLRHEIQKIAVDMAAYGSRRIAAELKRRGWRVNRKRVQRIMREDNLLCLRQRSFVVTTDSKHSFMVYPNLAGQLEPAGTDQLWVADITYIRLAEEFVYLAVILDAYSRARGEHGGITMERARFFACGQVIGWSLERTLAASLTVAALRMALQCRRITPELVHHSDRGVQYASHEYTALLLETESASA